MSGSVLALLSTLIITVGSTIVGYFTVKQNRQGARTTAALENRKVDREDFDSITRELRQTIKDNRSECDSMIAVQRQALADMREELDHEREQRHLANGYSRTLAQKLREHATSCHDSELIVPPPPAGLDFP